MVELDKPVTMANYVFILLSTMMTSIAFNHVILRGLFKESDPIKDLNFLYKNKVKMESLAEQMDNNVEIYLNPKDADAKKNAKDELYKYYKEYKKVLKAYTDYVTDANNSQTNKRDLSKLFPTFNFKGVGYPLESGYVCDTQDDTQNNSKGYFTEKVKASFNRVTGKIGNYEIITFGEHYKAGNQGKLRVKNTDKGTYQLGDVTLKGEIKEGQITFLKSSGFSIGEIVKLIPDSKNVDKYAKIKVLSLADSFTNTGNEGFEGKYELTDEGKFKDKEYTQNITNGSIAVYIFAILISIAGFIYHTHAYHIMGAVINMAIAAMGLHLWTLYHDKKNNLDKIDKSYMENIILASWVLCLLTLTVFIFIYLHNDDSSF